MSELKEHLFVPYSELQEGDELTDAITIAKSYYLKSEADKVITHHKYKRCLAMVKYCYESAMWLEECGVTKSATFMLRWQKRWLELAEKFKEAK